MSIKAQAVSLPIGLFPPPLSCCAAVVVQEVVVGERASALRAQLEVSYPVQNGIVQSWEDMGHVWDHTFYDKLRIDPSECRILLTDPPLNPSKNRGKMVSMPHRGPAPENRRPKHCQ